MENKELTGFAVVNNDELAELVRKAQKYELIISYMKNHSYVFYDDLIKFINTLEGEELFTKKEVKEDE